MNPPAEMTEIVLTALGGPEQLSVQHAPILRPTAGQVLVCVEAAGGRVQRRHHAPRPQPRLAPARVGL